MWAEVTIAVGALPPLPAAAAESAGVGVARCRRRVGREQFTTVVDRRRRRTHGHRRAGGCDQRRFASNGHGATQPAAPPAARPAGEPVSAADGRLSSRAGDTISFDTIEAKRESAVAYSKGDFGTALTQLEAAVASSPQDPEARNNLGQLLVRLDRAAESLPHFDEAVRLDGQRWAYRFNRARAYGVLDRWPDAVTDYRVAASLFPGDHATLYNLGLALLRTRDYSGAVVALEQAVAAAPEEHGFLLTLATAYSRSEQPDRARATFQRFLEVAPDDADAPRVKALLDALAAAGR